MNLHKVRRPSNGNRFLDSTAYDPEEVAASIEEDFRLLMKILGGSLKRCDDADNDLRTCIAKSHGAAKRGLTLAEQLLQRTRSLQ